MWSLCSVLKLIRINISFASRVNLFFSVQILTKSIYNLNFMFCFSFLWFILRCALSEKLQWYFVLLFSAGTLTALRFRTLYYSTVVRITLTIKKCHQLIRTDQSKLTCWLCEKMAHTKCAGYTCRPSDDLAKGHNLLYCCDPCHKLRTRWALHSQFNGLKLLDESPKRKKATSGRQPSENTPQPPERSEASKITAPEFH